ncbi:Endov [Symbiodinium sp. CCMP2456]|nr:Endov [Symbiodinium sp. CCMP2456]
MSYLLSLGLLGHRAVFWRGACAAATRPVTEHVQNLEPASVTSFQLNDWECLQKSLRSRLQDWDDDGWTIDDLRRIGGLDISFEDGTNRATAVLVVCELRGCHLKLIYEDSVDVDMALPYISGFLFVREIPAYELLLQRMRDSAPDVEPDVFLVDGSGLFHPRQCGSASHFGILHNLRTIGVAKKLLCFEDFDREHGQTVEEKVLSRPGDSAPLVGTSGFIYGFAVRTSAARAKGQDSSRRLYVSAGHRFSQDTARNVVLTCNVEGGSYVPEPIRLADLTGRAIERAWKQIHSTSKPQARQMIMDVSNLLDDKQRKTLVAILDEVQAEPCAVLSSISADSIKRKQATKDELFQPLQDMYPDATMLELRAALKMEKPWAADLRKASLRHQQAGRAMRLSR